MQARVFPPPARRRRRLGFTLLELMISLTVGGIAITSIYAIGASATRNFHQQQQVATAQTALRMAMNQVKRDIARAGYLFTPNANQPALFHPQSCAPASAPLDDANNSGRLAAFSRWDDNVIISTANNNTGVDPTGVNAANGFSADNLTLFGNYETSAEYPGVTIIDANTIAVDQDWHAFQRDFTFWYNGNPGTYDQAAFNEAFRVNRLIRIQTTRKLRHFAQITRLTHPGSGGGGGGQLAEDDVLIQFTPALPSNCLSDVNGGWVAPVSAIRYFVQNAPTGLESERFANTTGPIGQLIRREVWPTDKVTPLAENPGNTRAVLDYVVAFNLEFTMNTSNTPGQNDVYAPGLPTARWQPLAVNATPERIRAVSIDLAVRTPEQDPTLPWTQTGCANLRCFQVFPSTGNGARRGSARVRREHAEVFVPNVAFEGY
jgi:prepilin-type N-terminal cleavage/methylation domain-containing protein